MEEANRMLTHCLQILLFLIFSQNVVAIPLYPQELALTRHPVSDQVELLESLKSLHTIVTNKTEELRTQYQSWVTLKQFITSLDAVPYLQQFLLHKHKHNNSGSEINRNVVGDFVKLLSNYEYDSDRIAYIVKNANAFNPRAGEHTTEQQIQSGTLEESGDGNYLRSKNIEETVDKSQVKSCPHKAQALKIPHEEESNAESSNNMEVASEENEPSLNGEFLERKQNLNKNKIKGIKDIDDKNQNVTPDKTDEYRDDDLGSSNKKHAHNYSSRSKEFNKETIGLLKQMLKGKKKDEKNITQRRLIVNTDDGFASESPGENKINSKSWDNEKPEDVLEHLNPLLGIFVIYIDPITKEVSWKPRVSKISKSGNSFDKEIQKESSEVNLPKENEELAQIEITINVNGLKKLNDKTNSSMNVQKNGNGTISSGSVSKIAETRMFSNTTINIEKPNKTLELDQHVWKPIPTFMNNIQENKIKGAVFDPENITGSYYALSEKYNGHDEVSTELSLVTSNSSNLPH